jgi:hypothetical protein
VDVFIRKVRQKLEKASPDWEYIHTHFGVGYRFDPERRGGGNEEHLEPPARDVEPEEQPAAPEGPASSAAFAA